MRRRLFTVLSALSLLLCVLTLAAWWRGRSGSDSLLLRRESLDEGGWRQREWQLDSGGGELGFCYWTCYADASQARSLGCPAGVRLQTEVERARPIRRYAEWVGVWQDAGERTWLWEHGGVLVARADRRGTVGGSWGGVAGRIRRHVLVRPPQLAGGPADLPAPRPSGVRLGGATPQVPAEGHRPLPHLRVRPARHARPLPRVRDSPRWRGAVGGMMPP